MAGRPRRITLDGQLLGYWEREAERLDGLAESARFAWQRRRYLRKAEAARAKAQVSRAREAARDPASRDPKA
ncbi:hypothetical protein JOE48_004643 [Methylobacterium sp. PvR107]|nr:hypothetical protein [Methylobacterium sp. PvR107]